MSPTATKQAPSKHEQTAAPPIEVDSSCQVPVFWLTASAVIWVVIASLFGLIASIKMHAPGLLADVSWLTYGRVEPAQLNAFLYGFAIQAGLGAVLWLIARLGRTSLIQPGLITLGVCVWNLGVTIGVVAILGGATTGYEWLELPSYVTPMLFFSYLLIGALAVASFYYRQTESLYVSQWFLLAALFWFPWIYSAAQLMLVFEPVRGTLQAAVDWWYIHNLNFLWFGLVGLSVIFYLIPKLAARPLHSYYQALFAFWLLLLFGSWGGVPHGSPLPAWIPSLSTVGMVLTLIPLIALGMNWHGTLSGQYGKMLQVPIFRFVGFGAAAFLLFALLNAVGSLYQVSPVTEFTFYTDAMRQLGAYGFFAMTLFGAIYYMIPRMTGTDWPRPSWVNLHFWFAAVGILLYVIPLALGGIAQGAALNNPDTAFMDTLSFGLMGFRLSTLGDLAMAIGHVLLLINLMTLIYRFTHPKVRSVIEATGGEPQPAEASS